MVKKSYVIHYLMIFSGIFIIFSMINHFCFEMCMKNRMSVILPFLLPPFPQPSIPGRLVPAENEPIPVLILKVTDSIAQSTHRQMPSTPEGHSR